MSQLNPYNKIRGPCWVYVRNLKYASDGSLLPDLPINLMINKYWNICWKREIFIPEGNWVGIMEQDHIWYQRKLHCVDGPAVINDDGTVEWWLNNKEYTQEEWFSKLTPEQQCNYFWKLDE
jgi:hypothetical protein